MYVKAQMSLSLDVAIIRRYLNNIILQSMNLEKMRHELSSHLTEPKEKNKRRRQPSYARQKTANSKSCMPTSFNSAITA